MGHTDASFTRGGLPQAHPRRHRGERRRGAVRGLRRGRSGRADGRGVRRPDDRQGAAGGGLHLDGGRSGRHGAAGDATGGSSATAAARCRCQPAAHVHDAGHLQREGDRDRPGAATAGTDTVPDHGQRRGQAGPDRREAAADPARARAAARCGSRPRGRIPTVPRASSATGGTSVTRRPVRPQRPAHLHGGGHVHGHGDGDRRRRRGDDERADHDHGERPARQRRAGGAGAGRPADRHGAAAGAVHLGGV